MFPYNWLIRKYWKNVAIVSGAVIGAILLEVISETPDPAKLEFDEEDMLSAEEFIASEPQDGAEA